MSKRTPRIGSVIVALLLLPRGSGFAQETVPLCTGLTIVGAVNEPEGDYEVITTVQSIDSSAIQLNYSTQVRTGRSIRIVDVPRRQLIRDLRAARLVNYWFSPGAPRAFPGTTALGPSTAVLQALRTSGEAEVGIIDRGNSMLPADRAVRPNIFDYEMVLKLRRVGNGAVQMPVIVNGARAELRAIRAQGEHMGDRIDWLLLDDPNNPLMLQGTWTFLGSPATMTTRVIKITHYCGGTGSSVTLGGLERALLEKRRADVYHLYFDFNSDRLRRESEPSLQEIAAVLRRYPEWKLAIEGHTDGVGDAAYNLELSRRRAAAVKAALVSRHGVAAARLETGGHGAASPKDTNATLEGRARNRRVELVRL